MIKHVETSNSTTRSKLKKLLTLISSVVLTAHVFAGESVKDLGTPIVDTEVIETSLFRDRETQVDVFGLYLHDTGSSLLRGDDDTFGGGIGWSHFFNRYLGLGVEGDFWSGNEDVNGAALGNLIARYPIDWNNYGIAPYVMGGPGVVFASGTEFAGHLGGGVEFRFSPKWSVFADGRYLFVENLSDGVMARSGLRYNF
ncbi:MAG: outer membrane beta-barrel protein [Verrucomicrobiota bacterium]|nr:outer membrane beta-barrel protein [Verrucomicrobiota bacterium]